MGMLNLDLIAHLLVYLDLIVKMMAKFLSPLAIVLVSAFVPCWLFEMVFNAEAWTCLVVFFAEPLFGMLARRVTDAISGLERFRYGIKRWQVHHILLVLLCFVSLLWLPGLAIEQGSSPSHVSAGLPIRRAPNDYIALVASTILLASLPSILYVGPYSYKIWIVVLGRLVIVDVQVLIDN
jgi:hypothetical protein